MLNLDQSPRISSVETSILDVPFVRLQKFARFESRVQSTVLIRIKTECDHEGLGEVVTPCGPWWSGDSVEAVKSTIDLYFMPELIGANPLQSGDILRKLDKIARGNAFAKAGIEMALLDLAGKIHQMPVHDLLGGKVRDALPIAWPIASGNLEQDIAEMEKMVQQSLTSSFKVKMGMMPIEEDLARVGKLCAAAEQLGASIRVDPNEAWNEVETRAALPVLGEFGVEMIEQPLARWNLKGMARLNTNAAVTIMLDESICTAQDMFEAAALGSGNMVSLKLMKSGGMRRSQAIANIAEAAGTALYMGTFLETSLGTAANLHLAATLQHLPLGGETIGPLLMADDVVTCPIEFKNGCAHLPEGVGLGVTLDEDKVSAFTRR